MHIPGSSKKKKISGRAGGRLFGGGAREVVLGPVSFQFLPLDLFAVAKPAKGGGDKRAAPADFAPHTFKVAVFVFFFFFGSCRKEIEKKKKKNGRKNKKNPRSKINEGWSPRVTGDPALLCKIRRDKKKKKKKERKKGNPLGREKKNRKRGTYKKKGRKRGF